MIEKSTYFYSDEESLDPTCAFVGLIVQLVEKKSVASVYFWVQKKMSIVFQRFIMKCKYRITNSY